MLKGRSREIIVYFTVVSGLGIGYFSPCFSSARYPQNQDQ